MDKQDRDLLIRIDESLNGKTGIVVQVEKILICIKKQNNRIRSLEKWKHIQVGMFLLIGLILGVARFW